MVNHHLKRQQHNTFWCKSMNFFNNSNTLLDQIGRHVCTAYHGNPSCCFEGAWAWVKVLNGPGCSFRRPVGVWLLPALAAEMTLACTAVQLARLSQLPERRLSDSASQFYLKSSAELKKPACILSRVDKTTAVSNHTSDFIIAFSQMETSKSP